MRAQEAIAANLIELSVECGRLRAELERVTAERDLRDTAFAFACEKARGFEGEIAALRARLGEARNLLHGARKLVRPNSDSAAFLDVSAAFLAQEDT